MTMDDRRTRILGKMLDRFVGKKVIVLGHVTKIGSAGNTIELTTFDDVKINISVPDTIEAKPTDILEVWGTVKSKGTMDATQCILFSEENSKDFDEQAYNSFVIMQHALNDRKWKLNEKSQPLN